MEVGAREHAGGCFFFHEMVFSSETGSYTAACYLQFREEKKCERRSNSVWYTDVTTLRDSLRETDWCLAGVCGMPFCCCNLWAALSGLPGVARLLMRCCADAGRVQLPVQSGRRADGDYLQVLLPAGATMAADFSDTPACEGSVITCEHTIHCSHLIIR